MQPYRIIIEPGSNRRGYFRDVWRNRELLLFLTWRDIRVRYRQTLLGVGWAVVRPLTTMVVLTIVFGKVAGLSSEGGPYALIVLTGLFVWILWSSVFAGITNCLIANTALIQKVYFPRMIFPFSATGVGLVDWLIAAGFLLIWLPAYGIVPSGRIVLLPAFIATALCSAFGLGLWFCALAVRFRDAVQIVPFIVQLGMYLTPVGFGTSNVPEQWKPVFQCNPLTGIIEGVRWSILPTYPAPHLFDLVYAFVWAVGLVLSGMWFFRRRESTFPDYL